MLLCTSAGDQSDRWCTGRELTCNIFPNYKLSSDWSYYPQDSYLGVPYTIVSNQSISESENQTVKVSFVDTLILDIPIMWFVIQTGYCCEVSMFNDTSEYSLLAQHILYSKLCTIMPELEEQKTIQKQEIIRITTAFKVSTTQLIPTVSSPAALQVQIHGLQQQHQRTVEGLRKELELVAAHADLSWLQQEADAHMLRSSRLSPQWVRLIQVARGRARAR